MYDTLLISSSSEDGLNLPTDRGSAYRLSFLQNVTLVKEYRVKDVVIPQTYFTIKTGELVFALVGNVSGSNTYAVPPGNYSSVSLANQIANAWNTLTGTLLSFNFNNPDFRLVISVLSGTDATIQLTPTELASAGMASILGFTSGGALASSITANNVFNIDGPQKILVCSTVLNTGRNMISRNGQYVRSNVIYSSYRTGNGGNLTTDIIPGDWQQFQTPQNLSSIDLYLTDENEVPLDLNGYAWNITLEFRQCKNV